MTHTIEIDFLPEGETKVQTLLAEMDTETHGQVVGAQQIGAEAIVSVNARLTPTGPLYPRLLRGDLIKRIEPI